MTLGADGDGADGDGADGDNSDGDNSDGDKDSLDLKRGRTRLSPEPGRRRSPKRKVKSPGKTAWAFLFPARQYSALDLGLR